MAGQVSRNLHLNICFNNKIRANNKTYQIPFGLAHLLEHNIVENSIYDNAIAYFNQNYVASNAYTTDFRTMFYIDVVCDFEKHLEELITMVNKPLFTNKLNEIKKPIYEEIKRKQRMIQKKLSIKVGTDIEVLPRSISKGFEALYFIRFIR